MKIVRNIIIGLCICLLLIALTVLIRIITYRNPSDKKLVEAGIVEKQVQVGDVLFNYAEGPDNGPALILLHAQLLDWYTYSSVLPDLSEKFHVYAIDYPGHGKTVVPDGYEMSAENIGSDLGRFIDEVVGEAVYVAGNSSGGLLTTWLAANRKDIVKAAILEDPPLFSSEYPEVKQTVANKAFTQSKNALESDEYNGDYLMYWINNSDQFFSTYVFDGAEHLIKAMVSLYRKFNAGEPVEIAFMPVSVQEMLRGMDRYDPEFGAAFYDGTWNQNFDHATALSEIDCPVLLIQANTGYLEDGTLDGAMSKEMAQKAMELLKDGSYVYLDAGHVTNLEVPEEFVRVVEDFIKEDLND
ncbi:MAG: alpha/beta hydrolase [Acetatifactor sp.]|nr:alpha/beta hydrolase [Acetatifactor sp.]